MLIQLEGTDTIKDLFKSFLYREFLAIFRNMFTLKKKEQFMIIGKSELMDPSLFILHDSDAKSKEPYLKIRRFYNWMNPKYNEFMICLLIKLEPRFELENTILFEENE
jgi:hypothetical protein